MEIRIICVPYDLGHGNRGKGRAPDLFLQGGLADRLASAGHSVDRQQVLLDPAYFDGPGFASETGAVFEINRALSLCVRSAVQAGQWPLVLAGNCNSVVGTLAGLETDNPGIAWFDAHGDFNTPEITRSGYIDGMGLAMAAGRCWQAMLHALAGFKPVPESRIVHVGATDLDVAERAAMRQAAIPLVLSPAEESGLQMDALAAALDRLQVQIDGLYIHLDMDVLLPPGPPPDKLRAAVEMIRQRFPIAGCGVASYDPGLDPDHHILLSGIDLILDMVSA